MTFDINKADLVDTTHVDAALASIRRNEENARRRGMVLTWSRAVLLGGIGVAAIIAAAALFGLHPRVIETTRVGGVEKPVIVEKQVVAHDKPRPPEAPAAPKVDPAPAPKAPPPPPVPAPTTETHPWDKLADKQYVGIITDVIHGAVCVDHDTQPHHCIQDVEVDELRPRQARP